MRKLAAFLVVFCAMLSVSVPATALESKLTGYFLVNGFVADLGLYDGSNKKPDRLVDQRFYLKYLGTVNEYMSFTYKAQINNQWGTGGSSGGRRSGAAAGASAVNIENKNLYMTLAIPSTSWKTSVGYQTMGDNTEGWVFGDYYSGVRARGEAFNGIMTLGWAHAYEGDTGKAYRTTEINELDDVDMLTVQYQGIKFETVKPSLDLIYISNRRPLNVSNPANTDIGVLSIPEDATENLFFIDPMVEYSYSHNTKLTAYLVYEFGEQSKLLSGRDVTVGGYVMSGKAETKGSNWHLSAQVVYASADDDAYDTKQKSIRTPYHQAYDSNQSLIGQPANSIWCNTGLMIMAGSSMGSSYPGGAQSIGLAVYDGYLGGYGLTAAVVRGDYVPTSMPKMYLSTSIGSFMTNEDNRNLFGGAKEHEGTYMGTEAALHIGYKPYENLDLSINFAYTWLGDFYDNTSTGKSVYNTVTPSATSGVNIICGAPLWGADRGDPDNPCMAVLRAKMSF